jgi:glycosyltransferase involved in cell wall biosynthesis
LYLGRLHEKKGLDLLVDAFGAVCGHSEDSILVIAGPNQEGYGAKLDRLIHAKGLEQRVLMCGAIYQELKWAAYQAADVFVLPSHQENFAITVAEALSGATPVIITNKVNIWREIAEHQAGLVCDDSSAGVAAALGQWTAMSDEAKATMRAAARACFEKQFDVRRAGIKLLELIRTAVSK